MLGDSMRRRRSKAARPVKDRPSPPPRPARTRGWVAWLGLAAGVTAASFGVGYLLAVFVLFPAPADAAAGAPTPDVRGRTLEEADAMLRAQGLAVDTPVRLASSEEEGTVIAQTPLPGQRLRSGAAVQLVLSRGPARFRVPPLRGMDVEQATALLQQLDFEVSRRQEASALAAGLVVETVPEEGSQVTPPAELMLVVSTGPPAPLLPTASDTLPFRSARPGGSAGNGPR